MSQRKKLLKYSGRSKKKYRIVVDANVTSSHH